MFIVFVYVDASGSVALRTSMSRDASEPMGGEFIWQCLAHFLLYCFHAVEP